MRDKTRKLAVTALMLAVAVVLLYIASLVPTGRLALAAAAGLGAAACVIEGGMAWGLACWIGATLLGVLIVPDKGGVILFGVFFGVYPVIKSLLERRRSRVLEWVLKFAFFNLALTLCWLAWRYGFMAEDLLASWALWLVYIAGNGVFFLYDIGFSKLIAFYIARVALKRHRK